MAKKNKNAITINDVTKSYQSEKWGEKVVFENLNITFEKGKIHCILGVSGCGKSTLLKIIAGLENVKDGEIVIEPNNSLIAIILQDNNLLPWLTVYDNIAFALKALQKEESFDQIVQRGLQKFNLIEYQNFYPFELSEGLKQKVALAKTLVTNPNIVLLDEPFCSLDFISKNKAHKVYLSEFSKEHFTSILLTHDIEETIKLGDYIHLLGKGNDYKKFTNPLKKPRNKDENYQEFLNFIIKEYT